LKSLRPHERRAKSIDVNAPAPDVLNNEVRPADLSIAATQNVPARRSWKLTRAWRRGSRRAIKTGETAAAPGWLPRKPLRTARHATLIALVGNARGLLG